MAAHPAEPDDAQPTRPGTPRLHVSSVEPKLLGMLSPASAFLIGLAALILGTALLVSGSGPGTVPMLIGIVLLALAIHAARRWPSSALPRIAGQVADTVGGRVGLARASVGARTDAAREKVELEGQIRTLRDERRSRQAELGEAAYREEGGKMERLRRRLARVDGQIDERKREIEAVDERAGDRIDRERAANPATQPFAVAEVPPPLTEDDDTRVSPTEERPAVSDDDR